MKKLFFKTNLCPKNIWQRTCTSRKLMQNNGNDNQPDGIFKANQMISDEKG